jgi:hypothetical protein
MSMDQRVTKWQAAFGGFSSLPPSSCTDDGAVAHFLGELTAQLATIHQGLAIHCQEGTRRSLPVHPSVQRISDAAMSLSRALETQSQSIRLFSAQGCALVCLSDDTGFGLLPEPTTHLHLIGKVALLPPRQAFPVHAFRLPCVLHLCFSQRWTIGSSEAACKTTFSTSFRRQTRGAI